MEIDESKLIKKASRGDASAFNLLMSMHEKRMFAVALRVCGNYHDAQDCLSEAMIRVFKSIGGFKGESSFSTWTYRITMNTCLDELRRKKGKPQTSLDDLVDDGWSPADTTDGPETHAVRSELSKEIMKEINNLPEEMRSAFVLRDIEGYAYDEIARMLDINVGTVKSRISRAREKMRAVILKNKELFGLDGV